MFVEIGQLMPSNKRTCGTRYSKKLRLQIVNEVENGTMQREIVEKYGITSGTLVRWMDLYGSEQYHQLKLTKVPKLKKSQVIRALKENRMTREEAAIFCKVRKRTISNWINEIVKKESDVNSFEKKAMPPTFQSSQEKELAAAQLKIKALETLIDIAEEKFKIPIRKKPGAKQ